MNRRSAFTLLEIVVTIVILSSLISMALPRYLITLEKIKVAEAMNILIALKDAQILHRYENGAYTNVIDDLDVTIPAPAHFDAPTVATADPVAMIERKNFAYRLVIDSNGAIRCDLDSPVGLCAKVGCSGVGGLCN